MMPSRGSHMQPYPLVALCLIFFSLKNTHVIVSHTTPVPLSPHGDKDILSASCASAFLSRTCSLTSRSYSHLLGDSSFNRASHWRWIWPLYLDTELNLEDRILGEGGANGKESACQCKRQGFNHWITPSPGGGNGNPLQCSCLENPMNRGAWQVIVHRVAESRTWPNIWTQKKNTFIALPGKWGHSGFMSSKPCVPSWRGQWEVLL